MSNKERTIKSVSFSWSDAFEMKLLRHSGVQNGNFSVYVKRLIQRDMENGTNAPTFQVENIEFDKKADAQSFI